MNNPPVKYQCPACERAIVNRKIDRCLYFGAPLPSELLFSLETVAALSEETRRKEKQRWKQASPRTADQTAFIDTSIDAIEIASNLGSLLD
jgi:hypothetical protein